MRMMKQALRVVRVIVARIGKKALKKQDYRILRDMFRKKTKPTKSAVNSSNRLLVRHFLLITLGSYAQHVTPW